MTTPHRILLVDPSESDRTLAGLVLQHQTPQTEVVHVGSFVDFVDQLALGGFTAVIAEQQLGWGEGLGALALVRRREPQTLLFLFAREMPPGIATEAIVHGVTAYLTKSSAGYLELPRVVGAAVAQAQRQRHQEVIARAVNQYSIGVLTLSSAGVVRTASAAAARLLGAAPEGDLVDRPLESLIAGLGASPRWQALIQGRRQSVELIVRSPATGTGTLRIGIWRAREPVEREDAFYGVAQRGRERNPAID